ncbi:unnamed protein product [Adineta ricciae]|uniref:Ig-like domain-containing protein n=1 Tax=Adineta ricciae TaxID=249248 RepID=A0A813W9T5_ADIRI|nr:unnamed protein product [Adineta ricciae]CAF1241616.1 unnamed protein product [Adineta ricciae]
MRTILALILLVWIPSSKQINPPLGTSSVTFVFDVTGSMHDDLLQVIQGATHIYNATLRREHSIYDYILIPFADPDVGPVLKTRDSTRFQRGLQELIVQGGGDCPEMTITAIKLALEQSLPNSFIYVFTDARSKDYKLGDIVLKLIQEKQSQVVFVMTGDCGDQNHVGYQIFHKIAATSSGQVFTLHKKQVSEILNFVQYTTQTRKVNLLVIDRMKRNKENYTLAVDSKLVEFTISVSGANPQVILVDPTNKTLNPRDWFTRLLRLKEVYILNIKHPMIGQWHIQVTSSSAHSIRITGLSRLTFRHGFSMDPMTDLIRTRRQPIQGSLTHLIVEVNHVDDIRDAKQIELLDLFGNVLVHEPIQVNPQLPTFYSTMNKFQPPVHSSFFYIRLTGIDSDGHRFQRLSSTALTSYVPLKPVVNVEMNSIQIPSNIPTKLRCHVQSQLSYQVKWFKNGQLLLTSNHPADITTVEYSIDQPLETDDEGLYLCNATSTSGFDIGEIQVDVLAAPPVVQIIPSKSLFALINSTVMIDCLVQQDTKDYNLIWKQDLSSSVLVELREDRTTIYENGTLEIRNIQKSDDGSVFVCVAKNEGGETQERITIHVQEIPHVYIYPQTITYSHHWNITLACIGMNGIPRPLLIWRRQNNENPIEQSSTIRSHNGVLNIMTATKADEGFYECIGSNTAGEDIKTAQLIYAEPPMVSTDNSHILISPGDNVDLICNVPGETFPDVRWFKSNELVTRHRTSENGHLEIRNAAENEDSGNYSCLVQNTVGSSSVSIRLDIGLKPTINIPKDFVQVEVGESIGLFCDIYGVPKPQIIWFHNKTNRLLDQNDRTEILIVNAQERHAGIYTCLAMNLFGNTSADIHLNVTMIPRFTFEAQRFLNGIISKPLLLPCNHIGLPKPTVKWFKDDQELVIEENRMTIDSTGSLNINSLDTGDRGSFICEISNVIGHAKQQYQVDVYEPPSSADDFVERELDVNIYDSVLLPCSITAHPPPIITWFRQNIPIDPNDDINTYLHENGSLEIRKAELVYNDQYHCTATNPAGTITHHVKLSINIPPSITGAEEETFVQAPVNTSITLICPTLGTPQPEIRWFKAGHELPIFDINDQYIIPSIKPTDEGIYRCVAKNKAGSAQRLFNVSVYQSPYFENQSENHTRLQKKSAIINHTLVLICPAIGLPKPKIQWFYNGRDISSNRKHIYMKHNGKKLIITRIKSEDEGRYICQATNTIGSIDIVYDVNVMVPPKFTHDNNGIFAKEQFYKAGEYLRLPCSAEGKPIPMRRWFFNGRSLVDLARIRTVYEGLYIEIEHVTLNDAGRYTCAVENPAGRAENHIDVDVAVPPIFNDSLTQVKLHALINSSVTLPCSVYGFPKPSVTWSFETNTILESKREEEYVIDHVQVNHTGIYECIAKNRAGEIRKRFLLEAYAPPSINMNNETNRLIIRRNGSLHLQCPTSGHPIPITRWFKNEIEMYGIEKELIIPAVDRQDAGLYSCLVSNNIGADRRYFNIIISGPPEILRSHINTHPSVVRGSSITLSCPYTTERSSLITIINTTWIPPSFQTEHELTRQSLQLNDNQLIIPNVQIEDGQTWKCIVANEYGFDSLEFQLEILVPPDIVHEETEELFQVESNHTVQLTCQTFAHPPATIEWRKNGVAIDRTKYLITKINHTEILQIVVYNEHDGGTYSCIASNPIGKSEKQFLVDILLPPTFDYVPTSRHKIQLNRTYTLPCLVKGMPRPTIKWLKNGKKFDIDNKRVELFRDDQYLEIRYVNERDAGNYTCVAENIAGKAKHRVELQVLVPPRFGNDQTNIEAIFNSTINLTCTTYGNPKPIIVWLKEGRHLQHGSHYLPVALSSIQNDGRMIYTCIASNEAGNIEQHYRINRLVPPMIDSISIAPTATPIAGNHFTLDCNANGIPEPVISWHFNNQRLSSGHNRYYQVIRASLNDTGIYTCLAENKIGSTKKDIEINILLPPAILNNGPMINEITKLKGESLVLTCLLHAVPLPTIVWTKNDQILSNFERISIIDSNMKLYIENISLIDRGRYQCHAENLAGRSQQIFDIQVYAPPEIQLANINRNPYVILGKNIILSCHGFGVPELNYQWFKDEKNLVESYSYARLLGNGDKLQIDSAHLSDAGSYTCHMSNVAGQLNLTYQVDVFTPPTIDRSNLVEIYQVKSNQTARLECPMHGKPTPNIMWLMNGRDMKTNNERYELLEENRVLVIQSVNVNDHARYTCIGTNIAGELSNHIELQIFVPPVIQREPNEDNVTVIQHHHIALTCTANGDPWPSVSWEKDGLPVDRASARYRIGPGGSQLLIIQADPTQAGIYTCLAYSKAGEAKQHFRLTVLVPPRIERENTSYLVTSPKPIELPCRVIQGHPIPIVKWFHNNIELNIIEGSGDLKYKLTSSNSLLLLHTTKLDHGKYQCLIMNDAGQDFIDLHLDVNVPPIVTVESSEIIGIVNKPITLSCHVDGYPLPFIYWTKSGRSIDTQPGFQILNNGSLRIHHLQVQHTGYYLCWAENLVRRTHAQIRLEVQVPPSIDQIERHYTGIIGQSVKLSCQANGIPIPVIIWHGIYNASGTAIVDSFGNLYIDQLEKNHEGELLCSAHNAIGQTTKQFSLSVLDNQVTTTIAYEIQSNPLPFLVISPKNLTLDYGDFLELICQTNLISPLDIQWLHNGHSVDNVQYLTHFYDRNVLRINKAVDKNTGVYQCFANNSSNQQFIISSPVAVTVRPHPQSHNRAVMAGHRLVLSCELDSIINSNFLGTIEWFHNGLPLKVNSENRNRIDYRNGTLIVEQTSASDSGVYKCLFQNGNGTRTESYHSINIFTRPAFAIKLPRVAQQLVTGSMLLLNCLADAWPEPVLKWSRNGSTLEGIDGVRLQILFNNSLKIDPVELSDTGRYTCSAENTLGIATTTCDVVVHDILPTTTTIRHLQGEIKRINIDHIVLHWNSISKKSTFYQVPLILQSILQTNIFFLFPPSWFFLTTNTNNSFPYCSIDDAFHRQIKVSFADGSYLHIIEKASDESIQLNGTYPDDYQFEQEMILAETVVQTRRGMLVASR